MPAATPELITIPFGNSAGGSFITNPIPVPSQIGITDGAASFTDGFPPLTMTQIDAGGVPPFGQDVNGILYMITGHIAYISAGQPYVYNSTQAGDIGGYAVGATLARADGTGYWLNLTNANTSNPDTGGAGWVPAFNYGVTSKAASSANITLAADEYARPFIILTGTLTGNINLIFPTLLAQWLVVNETTGAFTITATTGAGNTVVIPNGGYVNATNVIGDGTQLWSNAISTAGLAPKASPALTGVPTAPTASVGTNTTQIATTAFANAAAAAAIAGLAPLASPTFSGVPTAPTAATSTNNAQLATTAFVHALAGISGTLLANGGVNFAFGLQIRWGSVAQTVAAPQAHAFSSPFSNACFVVIPVVASSTGVEFFTVVSQTASGWTQYSNNTTTVNYVAFGF